MHDIANMHFFQPRPRNNEYTPLHAYNHKQNVQVLHVLEFVRQGRNIADKVVCRCMGNSNIDTTDIQNCSAGNQVIEQAHLVGS